MEPPKLPPPPDFTKQTTTDGRSVDEVRAEQKADGNQLHKSYIILSEEERTRGFVRPVRRSYRHVGIAGPQHPLRDLSDEEKARYGTSNGTAYVKYEPYPPSDSSITGRLWTQEQLNTVGKGCQRITTMSQAIAETYARAPGFYGATMCSTCGKHFPVGSDGEFVWEGTTERVGT